MEEARQHTALIDEPMRFRTVTLGLALAATPLAADGVVLPSGLDVTLQDVFWDADAPEGQQWLRIRFLAPAIARDRNAVSHEDIEDDFKELCEQVALPMLAESGEEASMIFVSVSDIPVEFGQPDPDATQYFESFRSDGTECVWEFF